jgi:PAS domain S-box-containing protein
MKRTQDQPPEKNSWIVMMGLLGGRLATISGFLIFLSFVLAKDGIAFYAFIAFAYIITIPYSLWMRNQESMQQLAPLQFLVDLILVSGLIYFAGPRGHDFLMLLYPLIILSAGIILPLRQTIQITILSIISYALIILLMAKNILVGYTPGDDLTPAISMSIGSLLLRISLFVVFGIASAYVSRRCDYISKKEKQFSEITKIIFRNVKTGLLLLDHNDKILMANARACVLLGYDEPSLAGKSLSAIHLKPSDLQKSNPALRGASDYFRRADGSIFPVSIEDAQLSLPPEAVPDMSPKADTNIQTRILNFNDLSYFLNLQDQNRQLERIKAAADMAKEMAHQIRTPLTGLSGAAQLLQCYQSNPTTGETSSLAKDQEELYQQISAEVVRLDKTIQNFLDYAELSPSDARELMRMNINE